MDRNKSVIESLFYSLVMILCIIMLFIILGMVAYRIPMALNISNRMSIFAVQFYASILQVVILGLMFKYLSKKEEDKIINKDEKISKENLFDILIFVLVGFLLKNIFFEGVLYLEKITNTSPNYDNHVTKSLLEGMQVTSSDQIYSFIAGVILAPIVEELFFRKGVFKYFVDKEVTIRNVILISGISFGLTHFMGVAITVHSIITGIMLATIYAVTKHIIYPIIGHALNNLMPFATTIFRDNSGIEDVQAYIEAGRMIEIRGAIIISLILLIITSIISYIKRKTIISSDFKDRLIKVFSE